MSSESSCSKVGESVVCRLDGCWGRGPAWPRLGSGQDRLRQLQLCVRHCERSNESMGVLSLLSCGGAEKLGVHLRVSLVFSCRNIKLLISTEQKGQGKKGVVGVQTASRVFFFFLLGVGGWGGVFF